MSRTGARYHPCKKWMGVVLVFLSLFSCDLIRIKKERANDDGKRKAIARVNNAYLYSDELKGIVPEKTTKDDSAARINAYVTSWVRKQLLIQEALKTINIDEAEVERKMLDYRYSLIGYEFLNYYIQQHLNDSVDEASIENYYETSDQAYLYFLKVDAYKITDNISPLEFVKHDIKNIILNKRKVELAKKLEDEVYENAAKRKDFEVFAK